MPAPVDITDPFRALSDPTRREIVSLLAAGPLPVRMIAARFPAISRPAVSKHLRILREGALVTEERSGRERYYRVEAEAVRRALDWMIGVHRKASMGERHGRRTSPAAAPAKRSARASRPKSPPRSRPALETPKAPRTPRPAPPESEDWQAW